MSINYAAGLLYHGTITPMEYDWEILTPSISILQLISKEDIDYIKSIITSPRYAGNSRIRIGKIDEVMSTRGFTKYAGGTNRLVYTHLEAPGMVFKVAVDSVGIADNPAEYYNQKFLKPYCTKVFECSPCGTIASFQKVDRITTFEEFFTMIDDYYRLIKYNIIGKYVMEDIGIDYFMNFGVWVGHGLVILDFPYLYELDGAKLYCNTTLDNGSKCHGEIDYSPGFNRLICTKCGRLYRAGDLAKSPENGGILLRRKGAVKMKFDLKRGDKVIKSFDTNKEVEFLSKEKSGSTTNNRTTIHPVQLVKKIVTIKEQPKDTSSNSENRVVKHIETSHQKNSKENVKYITKTLSVGEHVEEKKATPISIGSGLKIVKKKVRIQNPNIKKEVKTIPVENKISARNIEKVTVDKPTVVKRVINVSLGNPKKFEDTINTKTDKDHSVNVSLVKVNKPVTVSTSVVKRLSKGSVIKNEKNPREVPKAVTDIKILDIGKVDGTKEEVKTIEEEKTEILNQNVEVVDSSKEIIENTEEIKSIVEEVSPVENVKTVVSTEGTSEEVVSATPDEEVNYVDVHFVRVLPTDISAYDPNEYILFAKYKGSNDFEDSIKELEYPVYLDSNEYDLYVLVNGSFYLSDGYSEDGTIILIDNTQEETNDTVVEETVSTDISTDDIINELKKSGKPSIEDML